MSDVFTATSPTEWRDILYQVKYFIQDEMDDISSIRVERKCPTCFKKISDVTLTFKDNGLHIKDWAYDCHEDREISHEIEFSNFDKSHIFVEVYNFHDYVFRLQLDYVIGSSYTIPLSNYYDKEDYEVHGQMVYKDRNLKLKQEELENGLKIMLQSFIDFKGLVPKYSEAIHIHWK